MLKYWPLLDDPSMALELLKPRFRDKVIREYTIKNLERLPDSQLCDYLLQLVQALKHELHHDSLLARFLLQRALLNRFLIGHDFFWFLKTELYGEFRERYERILEAYLRGCGTFRTPLMYQISVSKDLTAVAHWIKTVQPGKRKLMLHHKLSEMKLPSDIQSITDPA
jgi:hypothetical protein